MNRQSVNRRRSVLAVLVGGITTVGLSYTVDGILRAIDVMDDTLPSSGSTGLVAAVLAYRAGFNIAGCWVAARLAPNRPMGHALTLGAIGFLASLAGAVASNADLGPRWYAYGLVIAALPCAWIGGRLHAALRPRDSDRVAGRGTSA